MRNKFQLTAIEFRKFRNLNPFPGEAFGFWKKVAKDRGLDYKTFITNGEHFTAMALNHGKHFCWPLALNCKKKAAYAEAAKTVIA